MICCDLPSHSFSSYHLYEAAASLQVKAYGTSTNTTFSFQLNERQSNRHIGPEYDMYFTNNSPIGTVQQLYLGGVRYTLLKGDEKIQPFGRFEGGVLHSKVGSFFTYSFGGGLDYTISKHITFRVLDVQFPQVPSYPDAGLNRYFLSSGLVVKFK